MKSQKELILGKNWDYLIVLDACRHDYFEKVYKNFLRGELTAVKPLGPSTGDFLEGVFQERWGDTVYVSANPYVNSLGVGKFEVGKLFHDVVDVWDWGWNGKLGTVHPQTVTKAAIKANVRYPNKRLIIHYIQPHAPYIPLSMRNDDPRTKMIQLFGRRTRKTIGKILMKIIGPKDTERIRSLFGMKPGQIKEVARVYGLEGLRKVYMKNLRLALKCLTPLADKLEGKMIVTSDHGEALGEDGHIGHEALDIPWLEVEGVNEYFRETFARLSKADQSSPAPFLTHVRQIVEATSPPPLI